MRGRGAGTIINVASTGAFQPLPKMAVYGATKAFVLSFTEALWAEERKHGVRVLAVCPGLTDTPFFELAGDAAATAASGSLGRAFTRSPQQVVDDALRARLNQAFSQHSVLVVRDQHLSPQQVVDATMRALSGRGRKPSFVDGAANAFVARVLNRVLPRRLMIAVCGRLVDG